MTNILVIHPTPDIIIQALTPYDDQLTWQIISDYEGIQKILTKSKIDFAIAYHAMPKHDAKILLEAIPKLAIPFPIIIVADAPNERETVALLRRGAVDFISDDHITRLDQYLRDIPTIPLLESQLWALFDDALDIIMIVDMVEGKILSVNQTITRLLGYTRDNVLDRHFSILFPPESPYSVENAHKQIMVNDSVIEAQPFLRKDGEICRMDITVKQVVWDGQPMALMTMRDVTERYETMMALQTAQTQLAILLANAPIILWAINLEGEFTFYAGQVADEFGKNLEATLEHISAFDEDVNLPYSVADLKRALVGESFSASHTIGEVVFDTYFNPICNDDGAVVGVSGASVDVTEQIRAKQVLFEVAQERESINFREEFISMISHQFRTPLTVILTSVQMLDQYFGMLTPERRVEHLRRIESQSMYINGLLDDVMTIGSLQTAQDLKLEAINIRLFTNDIAHQVGLVDNDDNTRLFTVQYSGVETVFLDPKLLRHIIEELLMNAQKYTPEYGKINVNITINHNAITMIVRDNGNGIAPEDIPTLFEMFVRGSNVKQIRGNGLGLSLVKLCVEAHDGTISVESEVNKGTTFTVTLPCIDKP